MTLRRALGVAAADLYHQAWRLIILNTALGAGIVLVALASIAVRAALLLAILIGPAIAALMHCAVTLAQTEDLRLADALRGLRRHWRRGLALGLALAVAVALGALAVPFYAHAGTWAWPFAAVCIYLLLMFGVFQLALWPLVVFESDRPLRAVVTVLIVDVRGFVRGGRRALPQLGRGLATGAAHLAAGFETRDQPRNDLRVQLQHRVVELGWRAVLLRLLARDGLPGGFFRFPAEVGNLRLRDGRAEGKRDECENQAGAGHMVSFSVGAGQ